MRRYGSLVLYGLAAVVLVAIVANLSNGDWTDAEKQNAQYILIAFREAQTATRISNTTPGLILEEGDSRRFFGHLQQAYEYAQIVEDDVLDKVNPEMRSHWRNEFQEGLRLRLQNAKPPGNIVAEIQGQTLTDRFGDWWNANKRAIKIPKP